MRDQWTNYTKEHKWKKERKKEAGSPPHILTVEASKSLRKIGYLVHSKRPHSTSLHVFYTNKNNWTENKSNLHMPCQKSQARFSKSDLIFFSKSVDSYEYSTSQQNKQQETMFSQN